MTALSVLSKYPDVIVKPNYIADDEGIPTSHAPGNNADIECIEKNNHVLLEVTLLQSRQQVEREGSSISRHLREYIDKNNTSAITYFIAPNIHDDMQEYTEFLLDKKEICVLNFTIPKFVSKLENNNSLI